MERDKKYIELEEKKILLVYNETSYNSIVLTDKNARFILFEISDEFPKKTQIIHYLIQKEELQDINLN
tara:strand:+ start:1986 stop:2189 length:204 start_codon:yes stop_codon:yes gene_type:complete